MSTATPAIAETPTLDDVVAAAASFVPELQERAAELDELRQLPQDLADRLAAAGFYRICAPVGAGGLGLGPRGLCQVAETLASGTGAAGWCSFIASTSHLSMAGSTESFRTTVGADPGLIVAGVFSPSGTAVATTRDGQDGYLVNGHWRWGSGSHNAEWISASLHEVNADGSPVAGSQVGGLWLRPEEIDILDNWHVSGLRGTGSSDFVAIDAWVPADRAITGARHSLFGTDPAFGFPLLGMLSVPIGAICIGMARASLDEVATVTQTKTPNSSRRTLATRPLVHFQFAEAETKLRAARALLYSSIDEIWDKAQTEQITVHDRVAIRTANYYAVQAATEVIDQMFSIVGGTSVYETSPLQRHRRDVHVAGQHMMAADSVMELAGRVMLGVDDKGVGL